MSCEYKLIAVNGVCVCVCWSAGSGEVCVFPQQRLQEDHLPQLETWLQRWTDHVHPADGEIYTHAHKHTQTKLTSTFLLSSSPQVNITPLWPLEEALSSPLTVFSSSSSLSFQRNNLLLRPLLLSSPSSPPCIVYAIIHVWLHTYLRACVQ